MPYLCHLAVLDHIFTIGVPIFFIVFNNITPKLCLISFISYIGRKSSSSSSGFLGCVRLLSNAIERLKDTGYQRLDLVSDNNNPLPVKGQIVISLLSRDGHGTGKLHKIFLFYHAFDFVQTSKEKKYFWEIETSVIRVHVQSMALSRITKWWFIDLVILIHACVKIIQLEPAIMDTWK